MLDPHTSFSESPAGNNHNSFSVAFELGDDSQDTGQLNSGFTTPLGEDLELSIVIPCLNEHETVGKCVRKAMATLELASIHGEVIVADNGSSDGSQGIAANEGARVVSVASRGYGSALMGGINEARGRYIIMGDADDSYDFGDIPKFLQELRNGGDFVQGCRLPSGGGVVMPQAMPWLHRWIGNPGLTWLSRQMFGTPIHDINCGMRGFSRASYQRLELRSPGMEFATEMLIKATLFGARIKEVAITLWPDGRKTRRPHLRTFRDGWRHLRLYLIYSPRWLFWYPGLLLIALGLIGYGIALPGLRLASINFDVNTLLVASMLLLVGFQSACFAIVSTAYAASHRYRPLSANAKKFFDLFTIERGILIGIGLIALGLGLVALMTAKWFLSGFGALDYPYSLRVVIPGVTALALGTSTVFCSFLCGIVGTRK